jgi:cobalamin biosynthesis Mg chelatase CobN
MRRLSAAVLAALLLVLAVPIAASAQAIDPGTPTTIDPSTGTATQAPGTTPSSTPAAPPATGTQTVPPQTTTTPPATSALPAPVATQPQPPAAQPAPVTATTNTADDGGSSRIALVVLIMLVALVALVLLIWGVATWQGLEPPWWPRVRHSLAEFGWRASGAWSDFTDWVRLGR